MRHRLVWAGLAAVGLILAAAAQGEAVHSELWGENGEVWRPDSRLPDFSFAGYRRGEADIPSPPVTHDIREDFGAVGDGETDDSEAFLRAVEEVEEGVVLIPEGRYVITEIIDIERPNLVFRGEDRDNTVLYFPEPLNDIRPNWGATTGGRRTSNYSWSGGFFWVRGSYQRERLADVTEPAERGANQVSVSNAGGLSVGQEVDIRVRDDDDDSLAMHLYSEDPRLSIDNLNSRTRGSLVTRITAIDGDTIEFDRPLRFDIRGEWEPGVYRFEPTVTEVGIENLTFEFPNVPYEGHFTELGANAFAMTNAANCWVRNVRVVHSDSGGFVSGQFVTVKGIILESERDQGPQRNAQGHHGVYYTGHDNVFTDFDFRQRFIHDMSVSANASGNVFSNGQGVDLCFDHHRRTPNENLFTNIHAGEASNVWYSGGGAELGAHCAARGTFWNIRADNPINPPGGNFGPWSMNFVGLFTEAESETDPEGRWFETIPPDLLQPQNLHEAQLERRLAEED